MAHESRDFRTIHVTPYVLYLIIYSGSVVEQDKDVVREVDDMSI